MSRVSTCLWYDHDGEAAARFYVSLIPNSRIEAVMPGGADGRPLLVEFTLDGQRYAALNGGSHFKLSEAASIVVAAEDQAEVDRLWEALTADGGQPSQCGWLKDRWGVSWQITPRVFFDIVREGDAARIARAHAAVLTMTKLDATAIEAA